MSDPKWHYANRCDRCGRKYHGWANAYSHGTVCNQCDVEMHSVYREWHGVRGYPAHQLDDSDESK